MRGFRPERCSMSPSLASRASAWWTGVRLTLSSWASDTSLTTVPLGRVPDRIFSRMASYAPSTKNVRDSCIGLSEEKRRFVLFDCILRTVCSILFEVREVNSTGEKWDEKGQGLDHHPKRQPVLRHRTSPDPQRGRGRQGRVDPVCRARRSSARHLARR